METHKLTQSDRVSLSAGGAVSDGTHAILEAAFCRGHAATEEACIAYNTTSAKPLFPPVAAEGLPDRIDCGDEDDTELLHGARLNEFREGAQTRIVRAIEDSLDREALADRLRVSEAVKNAALRELDGQDEALQRIQDAEDAEEAAIEKVDRERGEETAEERAKRASRRREAIAHIVGFCRDRLDAAPDYCIGEDRRDALEAAVRFLEGEPTDDDIAAARSEEHEPDAQHAEADREIAAATAAEAAGVPGAELRLARAIEGKKQCG